ncbi:MAG TPA: 2Fe-2S iron-sulfur cluster-binding protein [Polyangiales bacterium]|nr:2Fe-2S iron-sulfur cluster-binding protein [Polyangiales bacterium]
MPKITYVEANCAEPGQSVMQNAVRLDVPGSAADCGGVCACATCRVYVDETWQAKLGETQH